MSELGNSQASSGTKRKDRSGEIWFIQVISGVLLILLLSVHMIAHHFVVEGGLRTYHDVLEYISNPLIFALEVIFLILVTPHAMLGLEGIILDLGPSEKSAKNIGWIFRILTVIIIGYGIWLAVALKGL